MPMIECNKHGVSDSGHPRSIECRACGLEARIKAGMETLRSAKTKNVILQNRIKALEDALRISLEAMQANIAYAEHALIRGINAARNVL